MFDCVLNTPQSLTGNEVCFDKEPISLIVMKYKQKIKGLLNSTGVVNVEQWTKIKSACVATKLKSWNSLNYWV